MSDELYSVATAFPDVAALAQGYMNRADGERLLVPLADECAAGDSVNFVVLLADGTPAFAGSGRTAQVSDQGNTVPPESRFETLLDSLDFDERSQPVYDYIVTVRNAAYAQPAADSAGAPEPEAVEEAPVAEEAQAGESEGFEEEPTTYLVSEQDVADDADAPAMDAPMEPAVTEDTFEVDGFEQAAEPAYAAEAEPAAAYAAESEPAPPPGMPSLTSELMPTGILTRPALGVHWAPVPPQRPEARASSGLFRYNGSGLPVPERPPWPDVDPALLVGPAPHPRDAAAQAQATAAGAAPAAMENLASADIAGDAEASAHSLEAAIDAGFETSASRNGASWDGADDPELEPVAADAEGEDVVVDESDFSDLDGD
ncbi:MAG: hypothetical protein OEZ06_08725 [Myxococcales bacterium]|nr:hypothetical protein [Myxococcales bacterium]